MFARVFSGQEIFRFGGSCLLSVVLVLSPVSVYASNHDTASVSTSGEGFLSLNFRDVDIRQFIESVSKLTKRNFLIDSRVKGRVTIIAAEPISKEDLYDVMLSVLHFYGFAAIPDGSITKIVTAADAPRFPASEEEKERHAFITEVVKVNNLNVAELIKVIRPMLSKRATVTSLPKGDSVVISDTQNNLARIKEVIKRVDVVGIFDYEVISVEHAPVDSLIGMINNIYKNNNKALKLNLQADKRTNRLIVSGSAEVRRAVRSLVRSLDTPLTSSANIKVIYLRYADAQNLANILTRLTSSDAFKSVAAAAGPSAAETPAAQSTQQPTTQQNQRQTQQQKQAATAAANKASSTGSAEVKSGIQADVALNALIISGGGNFISAVEGIIRQLDVARAQVIIEVIIAELTDTLTRELGVDWIYNNPTGAGVVDLSSRLGGALPGVLNGGSAAGAALGLARGGLVTGAFSGTVENGWGALLRVLNSDQRANILSTPYIVTLDNEEASFTVGDNVPFRVSSTNTDGNRVETTERRDVGTTLVIKPQVTGGDSVKLNINQEVSSVQQGSAGPDEQVTTSVRKIVTTVQVRSGGLIVLGGLQREEQTENSNKVPGLGDIPYLGHLFKNQNSRLVKSNLMLFMRPRIIKDEAAIASISHGKYNSIRQEQLNYPRFNSLFTRRQTPKLRDLSKMGLFTDFGRARAVSDLVDPASVTEDAVPTSLQ